MPAPTAGITVANAPEWRPGDRWTYGWTSGTESGTKIAEVRESRVINGAAYYLVRIGDLDHYYTHDLEWAAGVRDLKVEARMVPPEPWFVWPLEVGRHWDHHGAFEQRNGSTPRAGRFVVARLEMVEVPAGRYQAFKIVHETDQRDSDEYWYAPDVRWYVRWIGRRGDQNFEERLKSYDRGPGSASAPAAPAR